MASWCGGTWEEPAQAWRGGVKVNRALLTGLSGKRGGAERERKRFRRKMEREREREREERAREL